MSNPKNRMLLLLGYSVLFPVIAAIAFFSTSNDASNNQIEAKPYAPQPSENQTIVLGEIFTGTLENIIIPPASNTPVNLNMTLLHDGQEQKLILPLSDINLDRIVLRKCSDNCDSFSGFLFSESYGQGQDLGQFSLIDLQEIRPGDTVHALSQRNAFYTEEDRLVDSEQTIQLIIERNESDN